MVLYKVQNKYTSVFNSWKKHSGKMPLLVVFPRIVGKRSEKKLNMTRSSHISKSLVGVTFFHLSRNYFSSSLLNSKRFAIFLSEGISFLMAALPLNSVLCKSLWVVFSRNCALLTHELIFGDFLLRSFLIIMQIIAIVTI